MCKDSVEFSQYNHYLLFKEKHDSLDKLKMTSYIMFKLRIESVLKWIDVDLYIRTTTVMNCFRKPHVESLHSTSWEISRSLSPLASVVSM